MIYVGIDPGKSGVLAIMRENAQIDTFLFDPIIYTQQIALLKDQPVRACVEKVNAMPGQGVTSMFSFGHNLGFIEGLLSATAISYQLVPPQKWKKEFSLSSDKSKSIEVCQKLFPDVNLLATPRSKKPHDGIAEAVLMCEYARRCL